MRLAVEEERSLANIQKDALSAQANIIVTAAISGGGRAKLFGCHCVLTSYFYFLFFITYLFLPPSSLAPTHSLSLSQLLSATIHRPQTPPAPAVAMGKLNYTNVVPPPRASSWPLKTTTS